MKNFSIYEDGNGGELEVSNNSVRTVDSFYQAIYVKLFGGNVEAITKRENKVGDFRFDWWGNDAKGDSDLWINSETEKALRGVPLVEKSRRDVESAVKRDLASLDLGSEFTVYVLFKEANRILIVIEITEPEGTEFSFVWDATKNELIEQITIG